MNTFCYFIAQIEYAPWPEAYAEGRQSINTILGSAGQNE